MFFYWRVKPIKIVFFFVVTFETRKTVGFLLVLIESNRFPQFPPSWGVRHRLVVVKGIEYTEREPEKPIQII